MLSTTLLCSVVDHSYHPSPPAPQDALPAATQVRTCGSLRLVLMHLRYNSGSSATFPLTRCLPYAGLLECCLPHAWDLLDNMPSIAILDQVWLGLSSCLADLSQDVQPAIMKVSASGCLRPYNSRDSLSYCCLACFFLW